MKTAKQANNDLKEHLKEEKIQFCKFSYDYDKIRNIKISESII